MYSRTYCFIKKRLTLVQSYSSQRRNRVQCKQPDRPPWLPNLHTVAAPKQRPVALHPAFRLNMKTPTFQGDISVWGPHCSQEWSGHHRELDGAWKHCFLEEWLYFETGSHWLAWTSEICLPLSLGHKVQVCATATYGKNRLWLKRISGRTQK